jgi:site-specific recombinase XerD
MQGGISLKQAVEEYKEFYLAYRNFAQRTRVEYINDLEDMVRYLEGAGVRRPGDVTLSNLVRYVADLEKRGFAGSTRKRKVISIRSFFSFLHVEGYIVSDIGKRLIVPFVEAKTPRYLTIDEVDRLLKSSKSNKRDYAIIQLLLHTGIKLSELTRLTLQDLQATSSTDKEGRKVEFIRVVGDRRKKDRILPISPTASEAIAEYLSIRGKSQADNLFLNKSDGPLGKRGVEKVLEKYFRATEITKVTVQSLRHTFVNQMALKGVDKKTIQKVLGVSDIRSTSLYSKVKYL